MRGSSFWLLLVATTLCVSSCASRPPAARSSSSEAWRDWTATENPQRDHQRSTAIVLEAIDVHAGQTIADVGAGAGYYTFRLTSLVGNRGRVYATDVEPRWVEHVRNYARAHSVPNVEAVRAGGPWKTGLEVTLDRVVMVNSVGFRKDDITDYPRWVEYLAEWHALLNDGGRLVFHWDLLYDWHIDKARVVAMFREAGFSGKSEDVPFPAPTPDPANPEHQGAKPGFILVFTK